MGHVPQCKDCPEPTPQATPLDPADILIKSRVEGCVNGVQAYRDDVCDGLGNIVTEGDVITQSPITGDFQPFPCAATPCSCSNTDVDYENCCCYIQSIDPNIAGGWVNQLAPCDKCLSNDVSIKWTHCVDPTEVARSYTMVGLSDTCTDSANHPELDFAFYSIIRYDIATPYWIVYIRESGASLGWYHYERQFKKGCVDFEIRRVGNEIQYLINGSVVRTTPDTTGGACLYYDDSNHGTLNNFITNNRDLKLCQIV